MIQGKHIQLLMFFCVEQYKKHLILYMNIYHFKSLLVSSTESQDFS